MQVALAQQLTLLVVFSMRHREEQILSTIVAGIILIIKHYLMPLQILVKQVVFLSLRQGMKAIIMIYILYIRGVIVAPILLALLLQTRMIPLPLFQTTVLLL